jgi:beta-1,4-mannosyltransferase
MSKDLKSWPVIGPIVVLYDRPTKQFRKLSNDEKSSTLSMLKFPSSDSKSVELTITTDIKSNCTDNPFLEFNNADIPSFIENRPALLVSSTSWTADEDFSILLDALSIYDNSNPKRKIYIFITGKGPMKDYYMAKYKNMRLKNVNIFTAWLPVEIYPKLLGCADLGISLHTSSSGLDLPMKIVDMFGARVPVLAMDFKWFPNC